jgi:hypothetical protein
MINGATLGVEVDFNLYYTGIGNLNPHTVVLLSELLILVLAM